MKPAILDQQDRNERLKRKEVMARRERKIGDTLQSGWIARWASAMQVYCLVNTTDLYAERAEGRLYPAGDFSLIVALPMVPQT